MTWPECWVVSRGRPPQGQNDHWQVELKEESLLYHTQPQRGFPAMSLSFYNLIKIWCFKLGWMLPGSLSPLCHKSPVCFFGFCFFQFSYHWTFPLWCPWQPFFNVIVQEVIATMSILQGGQQRALDASETSFVFWQKRKQHIQSRAQQLFPHCPYLVPSVEPYLKDRASQSHSKLPPKLLYLLFLFA